MAATQEILVLAPHPDDETFGCGGTLRLLAQAGAGIDVVFLTRGELGSEEGSNAPLHSRRQLSEQRTREALAACQLLGVRHTQFLDGFDGQLANHADLVAPLFQVMRATSYRRVFCPHPQEKHPDHQGAFQLFRRLVHDGGLRAEVWLYEVWSPLQPNMLVPIDSTMACKIAAMEAYQSQCAQFNYVSAFRGLAAYRALTAPPAQFVEAFQICDAQYL